MCRIPPLQLFSGMVLVGVLSIGAINLLYGGGIGLFRGAAAISTFVKEQIATGQVLLFSLSEDFNERIYKKESLRQRVTDLKVLVAGSSRVFPIGADLFVADRRLFYNAGMSGATLEDHVSVWQLCKELERIPEIVFLELDPWILNDNSGGLRWLDLDREFRSFEYSYLEQGPSLPYYLADRSLRQYWAKLTDLLSAPRLLVSLKKVGAPFITETSQTAIGGKLALVSESDKPPERQAFRADGSILYPRAREEMRFVGDVAKPVLAKARAGKFYNLNEWTRLSRDHMELLKRLLEDMHAHGVKVIGFTAPYAPAYYELLKVNKEYMPLLKKQSAFFRDSFFKFHFEYYDMLDPAVASLREDDFTDYIHPTRDGMGKVLRYIRDRSVIAKDGFLGLRGERQATSRD